MNFLDVITAVSPIILAALLVLSNRGRYRSEVSEHDSIVNERNEAIIGWHQCRKRVDELTKEVTGLRWLISTYGITPPGNLSALTPDKPMPPPIPITVDANPTRAHLKNAWRQENENLAFLKSQVARYGDADLARHNQIEAVETRILELERILDGME